LALFNSRILEWRFKITSSNNNINGYEVEALPVPRIELAAQSSRQGFRELQESYTDFLQDETLEHILENIETKIDSREIFPKCIHGFLAFLVQKMLN